MRGKQSGGVEVVVSAGYASAKVLRGEHHLHDAPTKGVYTAIAGVWHPSVQEEF